MENKIIRQRKEGEPTILSNGKPEILYSGQIGAMIRLPVLLDKGKGYIEKDFQRFTRTPGTRIIAIQDNKILLTKEFRHELKKFDYRIPGGKVFDSFEDYLPYVLEKKVIPEEIILEAGKKELQEEASINAQDFEIFKKSHSGASIEWDLYYIVASDISTFNEKTENEGEQIEEIVWKDFNKVKEMCLNGEILEDRTVANLLQFINKKDL